MLAGTAPRAAAAGSMPPAPVGTLETVAGPVYCPGPAGVDRDASAVRAMAVDHSGIIYVETGPRALGSLATVGVDGMTDLIRSTVLAGEAGRSDTSPPTGLATDRRGGVYRATPTQILRFSRASSGAIAGRPAAESATDAREGRGDGAPAAGATFAGIRTIATDEHGNVFVADRTGGSEGPVRIRFVNTGPRPITFYGGSRHERTVAPGGVETIVGGRVSQTAGDDAAQEASIRGEPTAMVVVGTRLYLAIAEEPGVSGPGAGVVRMVNLGGEQLAAHGARLTPGAIDTIAGGAPGTFGGDGGPARSASFSALRGMAADGTGNLYVADEWNNRVRRVDPAGTVTTFAGTGGVGPGEGGFNGNDRTATAAGLNQPRDVALGPDGRLYISDQFNAQIRFVDASGVIRLAPGGGVGLTWSCGDGSRPTADNLRGVAADGRGDLYFVTAASLKRVERSGTHVPVVGRSRDAACAAGAPCPGGDGGPAHEARLRVAGGVAAGNGGLFVVDRGAVRFVNLTYRPVTSLGVRVAPGAIETVVGSAHEGADDAPAAKARLGLGPVVSMAADSRGNLFVADPGARTLVMVGKGGEVTALGGDRPPAEGCCRSPSGVAVDGAGNLYVSDAAGHRVWLLNRGSGPVTAHGQRIGPGAFAPVAGDGTPGFGGDDGPALEAQLQGPGGLAADRSGNLYVADPGENTIRRVDARGSMSTVAGIGQSGFNGDGLPARLTALSSPSGLSLDGCGNLVIADAGNARLRRLVIVPECQAVAAAGAGNAFPWPALLAVALSVPAVAAGAALGRRRTRRRAAGGRTYQPMVPGSPLNGPTTFDVTHPP